MVKSLKNGMIAILMANIINLVFSLITNFVLPQYLSIDSYASIKTYQLYISYTGVIALGYLDGMYLKYGGKEDENIDNNDLNVNISTLRIFQIVMTVLMGILGVIMQDFILLAFSLTIFPLNMITYFKMLYQAVGEFERYGKIMNLMSGIIFVINMLLLFVFHIENYYYYLFFYVFLYIIICIKLEVDFFKKYNNKFTFLKFSFHELISNISIGILVMLGNMSSIILTSLDRWFVKILLDMLSFAQYSFAVTIQNFMNVAITPITITFYNYFCKNQDYKDIKRLRNYTMILAVSVVSCAFPAKLVLEVYLVKYLGASEVIYYLFAAQIFYIIINSIYVNLYKSQRKQKMYFYKLVSVILIGFILNVILYDFYPHKEAFAIGTLIVSIIWFILSSRDFKWLNYKFTEFIYPFIQTLIFLISGLFFNSICGLIIYIISTIVVSILLLRIDTINIIKICINIIKTKLSIV